MTATVHPLFVCGRCGDVGRPYDGGIRACKSCIEHCLLELKLVRPVTHAMQDAGVPDDLADSVIKTILDDVRWQEVMAIKKAGRRL